MVAWHRDAGLACKANGLDASACHKMNVEATLTLQSLNCVQKGCCLMSATALYLKLKEPCVAYSEHDDHRFAVQSSDYLLLS